MLGISFEPIGSWPQETYHPRNHVMTEGFALPRNATTIAQSIENRGPPITDLALRVASTRFGRDGAMPSVEVIVAQTVSGGYKSCESLAGTCAWCWCVYNNNCVSCTPQRHCDGNISWDIPWVTHLGDTKVGCSSEADSRCMVQPISDLLQCIRRHCKSGT